MVRLRQGPLGAGCFSLGGADVPGEDRAEAAGGALVGCPFRRPRSPQRGRVEVACRSRSRTSTRAPRVEVGFVRDDRQGMCGVRRSVVSRSVWAVMIVSQGRRSGNAVSLSRLTSRWRVTGCSASAALSIQVGFGSVECGPCQAVADPVAVVVGWVGEVAECELRRREGCPAAVAVDGVGSSFAGGGVQVELRVICDGVFGLESEQGRCAGRVGRVGAVSFERAANLVDVRIAESVPGRGAAAVGDGDRSAAGCGEAGDGVGVPVPRSPLSRALDHERWPIRTVTPLREAAIVGVMVEQPTGTVTLLFTDIEGSTRLLERLGRGAVPGGARPAPAAAAGGVRAARRLRGRLRGRCVLRRVRERRGGGRGGGGGAAGARRARGRTEPRSGCGWGCTPVSRLLGAAEVRRARRAPGGADHGGRARRPGACCRRRRARWSTGT